MVTGPLIVETPKFGRKNFTGDTHMPTPTKVIWTTNVNLINNAKHAYMVIRDVNPHVDMIVTQDIEMTSSCELSDFVLPANSWVEFQTSEVTASCSNPFLQIWGRDGIDPLFDSVDDVMIMAKVAERLGENLDDPAVRRLLEVRPRRQRRDLHAASARRFGNHPRL